jgi:hypothetical protein
MAAEATYITACSTAIDAKVASDDAALASAKAVA